MSRYPHALKIPASELPPPGVTKGFYTKDHYYYLIIENLLPESEPGVDPVETPPALTVDEPACTEPEFAEPEEEVVVETRADSATDEINNLLAAIAILENENERLREEIVRERLMDAI